MRPGTARGPLEPRPMLRLEGSCLTLYGWHPAPAGGAVRHVLGSQLLERASAQAEIVNRPGQVAGARGQRQDLADHGELLAGLPVDVDGSGLDLADDLAVVAGAQAI